MRWISYFILAYVVVGMQIGLGAFISRGGAGPNLVLLAAVFIALNAPHDVALVACFLLGFLQDMTGGQALGLYALSYGLVALLVVESQNVLSRGHWLTHLLMGFIGGLITAIVLFCHDVIRPALPSGRAPMGPKLSVIHVSAGVLFMSAIYSALLAPFMLGLLHRMGSFFAFRPGRRRSSGY